MVTRLLIVQHAEKERRPGDPGLSRAGVDQAVAAADALRATEAVAVYSSPLRRAVQTAGIIAGQLGLAAGVDEGLTERMNWDDDGRPLAEFLGDWERSTRDRDHQGRWGHSSRAAAARMEEALLDLASRHPNSAVVVVSHGGATVDLLRSLMGDGRLEAAAPGLLAAGVPCCAVSEIRERDGRLGVVAVADPAGPTADAGELPGLREVSDGLVRIRPPAPGDAALLVAGRDETFHRWLGPGADDPAPTACIEAAGELVGWVDYDHRAWVGSREVNIGYNVFAPNRGRGYATRAVQLLIHHLAVDTADDVATLLIHPENHRSLALAARAGFPPAGDLDGNPYFRRPVPPLSYSDGVVTLRPPRLGDLEADLEAKDDEQIRWLWRPEEAEAWRAMTPRGRRSHAARVLEDRVASFGSGPKWTFSVDAGPHGGVAYVDCDLANDLVPRGEANVSYAAHPDHRGRGYVSRAVRLLTSFLADHTGCREMHMVVDADNRASLRVPASLGAVPVERWRADRGRTLIRHTVAVDRTAVSPSG